MPKLSSLARVALAVAAVAALSVTPLALVSFPTYAQDTATSSEPAAPTDEQIAAGLVVWRDRGGCFNCHGDFGQGGEGGHFPAGPSLRKSQLDLETMNMVISCGLPGTKMPYNREGAYETSDCYGTIGGTPPAEVSPGASLTMDEINNLVAYIGARIHGQRRITKDQCVEFYDGDVNAPACAAYR